MIVCPRCNNTLPPVAVRCQFCGSDVSKIPRPIQPNASYARAYADQISWQQIVGNVLGVLWILYGALVILVAVLVTSSAETGPARSSVDSAIAGMGFCVGMLGCFYLLIGLGILFKWSFAPMSVYIICALTIFMNAVGLMRGLDPFSAIVTIFIMAMSGFQIYIMAATREAY